MTDQKEKSNDKNVTMHNDIVEDGSENRHAILEAVLFMQGAPVALAKIAEIMDITREDVSEAVSELASAYEDRSAGLRIIEHEDRVQMVTSSAQSQTIESFTKKQLEGPLSQAALEVLAVIAYRGPLTKPDIEAVRGVNCSFTLRNLTLRGLIERVPHPTDSRTKLYRVTIDCVKHMGIDSVQDLPHFAELTSDRRIDAVLYGERVEDMDEEV